ncbi:MAG: glycosyltransferase [Chloroflexi bacterium]|nr:glycosyltransferase [Chloroflexota bacterium]
MVLAAKPSHAHVDNRWLSDLKVLIVGNNNSGSAPIRAYRFLRQESRARVVTFIGHPLAEEKVRRSLGMRFGAASGRERKAAVRREKSLGLVSYAVDVLVTLAMLVRFFARYDLYIGSNAHLGLLGLLLRRLGLVRQTVFWTVDYFPNRYRNPVLNRLYLWLDGLCVRRSDFAWDLTAAMSEARRQRGVADRDGRVYTVPHPIERHELRPPEVEPIPDTLLYSGLVKPEYGFDLVLEALGRVAELRPKVSLTVTTYGPLPDDLRDTLRRRGLQGRVRLLGHIDDAAEYRRVVEGHRVGLAPYRPSAEGYKRFADVSRAKTYLARGVPVVITRVPPIAAEIERAGAGIVIDYDAGQLAAAILKLLSDEAFYRRCRASALALAEGYSAERVFGEAFGRMGIE